MTTRRIDLVGLGDLLERIEANLPPRPAGEHAVWPGARFRDRSGREWVPLPEDEIALRVIAARVGDTRVARTLVNEAADRIEVGLPLPAPLALFLVEALRDENPTRALKLVARHGRHADARDSERRGAAAIVEVLVSEGRSATHALEDVADLLGYASGKKLQAFCGSARPTMRTYPVEVQRRFAAAAIRALLSSPDKSARDPV